MRRDTSRFTHFIYSRVNDVTEDQRLRFYAHQRVLPNQADTRIPSGDECETEGIKDIKSYERRMMSYN